MHPLTIGALTALYALCHRRALTPSEQEALASEAPSLGPELWAQSLRFLQSADAAGSESDIDLGFSEPIHAWLGYKNPSHCLAQCGSSIAQALRSDCGRLAVAAHAVQATTPPPPGAKGELRLRALVAGVWAARASRLAYAPDGGAAALEAIQCAFQACSLPSDVVRSLWADVVRIFEDAGRPEFADEARRRMGAVPPSTALTVPSRISMGSILALSALWAITHDELLATERHLNPEIPRTTDEWERIRKAISEGRVSDIPVPTALARAWCSSAGVECPDLASRLLSDLEGLAVGFRAVESFWGSCEFAIPQPLLPALRDALTIARVRRASLAGDYTPPESEHQTIFYEIHQGARRPEAVDRFEQLKKLNAVFERHAHLDPVVQACVILDRAAECEAQGDQEQTLVHLQEAHALLRENEDPDLAQHGPLTLAQHAWASGQPELALETLSSLYTDPTSTESALRLRLRLEHQDPQCRQLRHAERVHRRRPSLETHCALAHAQLAAGQTIVGERTADVLCREYPSRAVAWETKAWILHTLSRHRDAEVAARGAQSMSDDPPRTKALLARILSRLGSEAREEAVACAEAAIAAFVVRTNPLRPSAELSQLADIVHRCGGSIESARAADDAVLRQQARDEPPWEWLGAATARRCHGVWSTDAVAWLTRLAWRGDPEDIARFVTDRVEYLQHARSIAATAIFGRPSFEEEAAIYGAANEVLRDIHGLSLRLEGARLPLRVASSLRVSREDLPAALSLSDDECASLEDRAQGRAELPYFGAPLRGWRLYRRHLEGHFGLPVLIQLRASQMVQRSLPGLDATRPHPLAPFQILEAFEREKRAWVRWVAASPVFAEVVDSGLEAGTERRLRRLFGFADLDDLALARAPWRTLWHR